MYKLFSSFLLSIIIVLLLGCRDTQAVRNTRDFVADIQKTSAPAIEPLPKFIKPHLRSDTPSFERSPFMPPTANRSTDSMPPNRLKEPLEYYPLELLRYTGKISTHNKMWALISVPQGKFYKVATNQHMGQNFGEITAINDTKIVLLETIPDGLGNWVQRQNELLFLGHKQEKVHE